MSINIAIDGPAGAGKSTIAKMVAKDLKFIYVDTGAMYRAMAYYFLQKGISPEDEGKISEECQNAEISIAYKDGEQQVILNGENVNGCIRQEEVGNMASATSIYPKVREKLVELQKELAKKSNVIMDGRDIGTCVLPDAQVKIYLTASVDTREKRRFDELAAKGVAIIMVSSELPEVLGMSDRVMVVREGEVRGILNKEEANQESIMTLATGGELNGK